MSRKNPEDFPKSSAAYRLGEATFSPASGEVAVAGGDLRRLRSQTAAVLACLLEHSGEVVSKSTLFATVWRGTAVTDDSLVQCISEIRRALGDRDHTIIQTVAKRGYRACAAMVSPTAIDAPHEQPAIAVLAFEDFSAGADQGYLSDAIAESVIAGLSRFSELLVIARNSSFSFRGDARDVTEISRQLGARYLLEGSQQKHRDHLRVTVQLIDAQAGHHIWSDVYEREMGDLLGVQDDIVRRVVATVAQKVIHFEGRHGAASSSTRPGALLHHLEARRHLIKFTPEANKKALRANLAAIAADPDAPFGYVGLAFAHINGHRWGWTDHDPAEALDAARQAAAKALDIAPGYYDGHAAMAYVHLQENDLDRAISRARRALRLNPNDTNVMSDLAEYLGYSGQTAEAETLLRQAMRLDPLSPDWFRWNLAWIEWLAGKCEAALDTMNAMTEIPPMANRVLASIYICLGQPGKARMAVDRIMAHDPHYSLADVRRNYHGKFRRRADYDRVIGALREAGLPE